MVVAPLQVCHPALPRPAPPRPALPCPPCPALPCPALPCPAGAMMDCGVFSNPEELISWLSVARWIWQGYLTPTMPGIVKDRRDQMSIAAMEWAKKLPNKTIQDRNCSKILPSLALPCLALPCLALPCSALLYPEPAPATAEAAELPGARQPGWQPGIQRSGG